MSGSNASDLTLSNPWLLLPDEPPYVLDSDFQVLRRFPRVLDHLKLDCPPVPWIGRPLDAKVLLLTLNPGYRPEDSTHDISLPGYMSESRASLTFESATPAWSLDPRFRTTGTYLYCREKLRWLADEVGWERVASGVAWMEFFPYHSESYRELPKLLPSQPFTFDLVRRGVAADKPIVVLRSWRQWSTQVPELIGYSNLITCRNVRASTVSPNNLNEAGFARLVEALRD